MKIVTQDGRKTEMNLAIGLQKTVSVLLCVHELGEKSIGKRTILSHKQTFLVGRPRKHFTT